MMASCYTNFLQPCISALDISSKSGENLEGIWGDPGEIPNTEWKIRGGKRVKLSNVDILWTQNS